MESKESKPTVAVAEVSSKSQRIETPLEVVVKAMMPELELGNKISAIAKELKASGVVVSSSSNDR